MKFLCDRCKTRYSIGDDRVRGKILKIRCKNCANVITVREGMSDADAGADAGMPNRAKKATTMAPMPVETGSSTGSNNALGQAFASAMTKPPPALEEEWYVSIDGDQSGPFSLAEAQRWVSSKQIDADLHCWSEGFDDWLPVDKVSHFRGLRKKAVTNTPPPLPRLGGTGASPVARPMGLSGSQPAAKPSEPEPQPLFAATMASLEKAAAPVDTSRGIGLGGSASTPSPFATKAPLSSPSSPKPLVPNGGGTPHAPNKSNGSGRANAATKPIFDASDLGDGETVMENGPFVDDSADAIAAVAKQNNEAFAKLGKPAGSPPSSAGSAGSGPSSMFSMGSAKPAAAVPLSSLGPPPDPRSVEDDGAVEGDGLDIGEVSRVVKLADIMRAPRTAPNPALRRSNPALGQAGAAARMTGNVPRIAGTGPAPAITTPGVNPAQLIGEDGLPVPLPLGDEASAAEHHAHGPISHKRGMIMLFAGAVALIGILLLIVVIVNNANDDDAPQFVAQYTEIDTTGRELIITINPDGTEVARDKKTGEVVQKPAKPNSPNIYRPQIPTKPEVPTGDAIGNGDIEAMARKNANMTSTCWIRSRKGAEDIVLSDVKKVTVFLTIAKDGNVTQVQYKGLPPGTRLETCLTSSIKTAWKFRPNPGATLGFTMVPPT